MTFGTKTALMLLKPVLTKVANEAFESVITNENLSAIRNKLKAAITNITGRTSFKWDDNLANQLFDKLSDPAYYADKIDSILDPLEEWIKHNDTDWDDDIALPAIDAFREAANIPDND